MQDGNALMGGQHEGEDGLDGVEKTTEKDDLNDTKVDKTDGKLEKAKTKQQLKGKCMF